MSRLNKDTLRISLRMKSHCHDPPQIRHIEDDYRSLLSPFEEIAPLPFRLVQKLDVE